VIIVEICRTTGFELVVAELALELGVLPYPLIIKPKNQLLALINV